MMTSFLHDVHNRDGRYYVRCCIVDPLVVDAGLTKLVLILNTVKIYTIDDVPSSVPSCDMLFAVCLGTWRGSEEGYLSRRNEKGRGFKESTQRLWWLPELLPSCEGLPLSWRITLRWKRGVRLLPNVRWALNKNLSPMYTLCRSVL